MRGILKVAIQIKECFLRRYIGVSLVVRVAIKD